MPNRSEREARVRLDLGMSRALLRQGRSTREMLDAFRSHFAIVDDLERAQSSLTEGATDALEETKAATRP